VVVVVLANGLESEKSQPEAAVMAATRGGGGARQWPMREYKKGKKENNQPELAVMAATGGGRGSSPRPMRKYKK